MDEGNLALDTRLPVVDMAVFDSADGLDTLKGGFGCAQGSETLSIAQQAL